jgi:type IV secretion system protein VirB10
MSMPVQPPASEGQEPQDLAGSAQEAVAERERPRTEEVVEAMRLRPALPCVTRLSRKVLLGLGIAFSLGIGGALIYAIRERERDAPPKELVATDNRATPDGLIRLPKDYSAIPRLGPPLPGDLGRPILSAQNAGKAVPAPPMGMATGTTAQMSPEEQRRIQEVDAARTARLFAASNGAATTVPAAPLILPADLSQGNQPSGASGAAQNPRQAFLAGAGERGAVSDARITAPVSPNILQAGAIIPIALLTGIRSDLPGQVTAQVTANVHDSPTGNILLIPQGTRIIGDYDSEVAFGQRRVLLAWNRLIFPNGRSIALDRQPGADAQGFAGLQDGVDYHWGQMARAAGLSTILGIGAELGSSSDESVILRALRRGAADSISDTGRQIVDRQLDVPPTLTVRAGFVARIIVTRDLVLEPYGTAP